MTGAKKKSSFRAKSYIVFIFRSMGQSMKAKIQLYEDYEPIYQCTQNSSEKLRKKNFFSESDVWLRCVEISGQSEQNCGFWLAPPP